MKLKRIQDVKNLKGKTVLVRIDCNVPVVNGKIDKAESFRLERVVPTIQLLVKRGAKVILLGHRGRPEGKVVESLRLEPVVKRMKILLRSVSKNTSVIPDLTRLAEARAKRVGDLRRRRLTWIPAFAGMTESGNVLMLENLRFDPREEANDPTFAKELASLGDLYVNDAFADSHRKHASVHAITKYLPSYAGLCMQEEVRVLNGVLEKPRRPFVVALGGAKISTKIGLIRKFVRLADVVLLGGALASTVLHLKGHVVGSSLIAPEVASSLKKLLHGSYNLVLPEDVVVAKNIRSKGRVVSVDKVQTADSIFDIGPATVKVFSQLISQARLVVANGPFGVAEQPQFRKGTSGVFRAIAASKAYSVVGGGETIQALAWSGVEKKISFLSTGGGAMLEFLEAGTLPGIKPLIKKESSLRA